MQAIALVLLFYNFPYLVHIITNSSHNTGCGRPLKLSVVKVQILKDTFSLRGDTHMTFTLKDGGGKEEGKGKNEMLCAVGMGGW